MGLSRTQAEANMLHSTAPSYLDQVYKAWSRYRAAMVRAKLLPVAPATNMDCSLSDTCGVAADEPLCGPVTPELGILAPVQASTGHCSHEGTDSGMGAPSLCSPSVPSVTLPLKYTKKFLKRPCMNKHVRTDKCTAGHTYFVPSLFLLLFFGKSHQCRKSWISKGRLGGSG